MEDQDINDLKKCAGQWLAISKYDNKLLRDNENQPIARLNLLEVQIKTNELFPELVKRQSVKYIFITNTRIRNEERRGNNNPL